MPTPPRPISESRGTQKRAAATAILVLGMHRSGTSAIARLLNLRGADLGHDLLPAKADNERGFWENRAVLELHEAFFTQQGLQWHDLIALAPDWQRDAPARRFVADLPGILEQQFAGKKLSLVKDPRLSLLAPLWIEVLRARNVRPVFVITIRHPHEVAASLARRDGLPLAQAQLLWLQHLIDAERATRGHDRVFVHYERLLENWQRELDRIDAQLGIDWPPASPNFAGAAAQFLAPTLRHHHAGRETEAQMPQIVADAYRQACAAAAGTTPPVVFEDLAAPFDALLQCAAPLYRALADRQIVAAGEHAREIERARAAFAVKETEIEQARSNIDALSAELGAARAAHVQRNQFESDLRAAVAERDAQIERAREAFALKEDELDAARVSIDALTTELGSARVNIEALAADMERARQAFAAKDAEIAAARVNIEALAGDLERARQGCAAKHAEIAAARVNIEALAGDLERARQGFVMKDAEIAAARVNIEALTGDLERARQGFAAKDAEIAAARVNVEALAEDLERAREAHAIKDEEIAAAHRAMAVLQEHLSSKEREIDAARSNIDALVGDIERARQGFAAKDAEIDAARRNIDNLVAEIERARQVHTACAIRPTRRCGGHAGDRLGRSLRLIDPHLNDGKSS